MNNDLDIHTMDASALLQLAHERQREEERQARLQAKAKVAELKLEYRQLQEQHRRELLAMDREIQALQAQITRPLRSSARGTTEVRPYRSRKEAPVTNALLGIVGQKPVMSVQEIRERAQEVGLEIKTVTQMLAYLKRTGRLNSPHRGHYALADH
jgi:hypothetical protein